MQDTVEILINFCTQNAFDQVVDTVRLHVAAKGQPATVIYISTTAVSRVFVRTGDWRSLTPNSELFILEEPQTALELLRAFLKKKLAGHPEVRLDVLPGVE